MSSVTVQSQVRRSGHGARRSRVMTSSSGVPYVKVIEQARDEELLEEYRREQITDVHKISFYELCTRYTTSLERGLSQQKADSLLMQYGPNCLTPPTQISTCRLLVNNLFGGFAMLIWAAIILIAILIVINVITAKGVIHHETYSHFYLGSILLIVVSCTGIFSFYHEDKSKKIMDYFQKMMGPQSSVIRDGALKEIPTDEIVTGDLVYMTTGSKVPADIRLTICDGLKIDNSALTGESKALTRSINCTSDSILETENIVFSSASVVEGSGKGIVFFTGDQTYIGKIAGLTSCMKPEPTPIRKEISHFVFVISIAALTLSGIISIVYIATGGGLLDAFLLFIGLVVANVPEGLLVTMTACLTLTAKVLAKKFCLCKKLDSIETLGSTSIILSDKTGTLTQNKMTVIHVWINNVILVADTTGLPGVDMGFDVANVDFTTLVNVASLCSVAEFMPDQENIPVQQRNVKGDASEAALLKFITRCLGENFVTDLRAQHPRVFNIPFSSRIKYALSIHHIHHSDDEDDFYLIAMKGAPEVILNVCSTIQLSGVDCPLSDEENDVDYMDILKDAISDFGLSGERVIAFASCKLPSDEYPPNEYKFNNDNFPKTNYKFCGLMALMDPPRATVYGAIERCKSAGIRVVMVTGDHPETAGAIAKKVGIFSPKSVTKYDIAKQMKVSVAKLFATAGQQVANQCNAVIITGPEIREMSTIDLVNTFKLYNEIIFARTTPQQKLQIVEAAQLTEAIVAVTGDGVNDAPAMKRADIGIAMGITGTEVAKEASNMILLDDNFASIINGIEQGRLIFDNFKKSIAFILTSSMPEMTPYVFHIFLKIPLPLHLLGIICLDFITDLWPGISLAYEKPERDIMNLPPRNVKVDRLINARMIFMTYGQMGMIQSFAGFTNYFLVYAYHGFMPSNLIGIDSKWQSKNEDIYNSKGDKWNFQNRQKLSAYGVTAFYVAILLTQMADLIICKTRRNSLFKQPFTNWCLNIAIFVELLVSMFIIYTPGVSRVFSFHPISWQFWIIPVPFCILIIAFDEVRKLIIRRKPGGYVERFTAY